MKIRFQADANLDPDIGLGLRRRDPSLDYREDRVLVTNDRRTLPKHFSEFISGSGSPGLLLIPPRMSIGETIEGLFLCWQSWTAEEMRNQIRWVDAVTREGALHHAVHAGAVSADGLYEPEDKDHSLSGSEGRIGRPTSEYDL